MKQFIVCIVFVFAALLSAKSNGEESVKAPRGWNDAQQGDKRVVSNGNATVTINPWHSLQGLSAEQWLSERVGKDPDNGVLLSSESVKPEAVPGAYSVLRKARFGEQQGYAVLYLCPGQSGYARLMSLDVKDGGFGDMLKGAMFGEKVCKKEPKGAAVEQPGSDTGTQASEQLSARSEGADNAASTQAIEKFTISDDELRELNQQIPAANRPERARISLEKHFRGFPAILTYTAVMVPRFAGGYELSCTDWDPAGDVLARDLVNHEDCELQGEPKKELLQFDPGERIELSFGNISASGVDGLSGSASSISGGDLTMNLDGRIAIGRWNVAHASSTAASARATSTRKRKALIGRYYLDGHTITIMSDEGEVFGGFIGYDKSEESEIDALFLNGTHYWDRDKKK